MSKAPPSWFGASWGMAVLLAGLGASASFPAAARPTNGKSCFFINSYAPGYDWGDRIEASLRQALGDACTVTTAYMDMRAEGGDARGPQAGREIRDRILAAKPDVIIACDDPASQFVIAPYFRDSTIPIVFCGINWSGAEYGYPWPNATGMIEVFPLKPLADVIKAAVPKAKEGVFIAPDSLTSRKSGSAVTKIFGERGLNVKHMAVRTAAEWEKLVKESRGKDFIVLSTIAGIAGLTPEAARAAIEANAKPFVVTFLDFSVPFAMFAMTEVAEEQGAHAGNVAARILQGAKPSDFPVIPNGQYRIFANPRLLKKAGIMVPPGLLRKAEKVE